MYVKYSNYPKMLEIERVEAGRSRKGHCRDEAIRNVKTRSQAVRQQQPIRCSEIGGLGPNYVEFAQKSLDRVQIASIAAAHHELHCDKRQELRKDLSQPLATMPLLVLLRADNRSEHPCQRDASGGPLPALGAQISSEAHAIGNVGSIAPNAEEFAIQQVAEGYCG